MHDTQAEYLNRFRSRSRLLYSAWCGSLKMISMLIRLIWIKTLSEG